MRLLFWNGRAPNLQILFDHYLHDFRKVLKKGIFVKELDLNLKINLDCFIADPQARPKVINSIQYNGNFGYTS
jgi:hypothetical protein